MSIRNLSTMTRVQINKKHIDVCKVYLFFFCQFALNKTLNDNLVGDLSHCVPIDILRD